MGLEATRLDTSREAAVAEFCRQCNAFFTLVAGESDATDTARHLLESRPPGVEAARKHVIGFERRGALVAIVDLLEGYPGEADWYVGLLILSPDERDRGLGSQVWNAVEAWIRQDGGRHVRLIVQEQNPDAARFWRAAGFTADGTVEQHLPSRTNLCWRFEKSLRNCPEQVSSTHPGMNASKYLAGRLRRTIHGPMWHGPAVAALLAGFTPAGAAAHPVPGAHSAWELVLHMAAWAEIAAARLDGGRVDHPPPDLDWPAPPETAGAGPWAAAQARLIAAYETLAARAVALPATRLVEPVPGQEHSVGVMLDGVVEHGTYHGGQLALLKRAGETSASVVA